jgi:hypothetical protein
MSCLAKPSGFPTSASRFMNYPYCSLYVANAIIYSDSKFQEFKLFLRQSKRHSAIYCVADSPDSICQLISFNLTKEQEIFSFWQVRKTLSKYILTVNGDTLNESTQLSTNESERVT